MTHKTSIIIIYLKRMINPHVLEMKDTIFYKRQIQEKLPELLGMRSLDQKLPITHDYICQLFKDDESDDDSSDQHFQQIQYFKVQPLQVISQNRSTEIQNYLESYFKQTVTMTNSNNNFHQEQSQNNFYFYYEINGKSAAIFVYKYLIKKQTNLINLYPCFLKNEEFLSRKTCSLIQHIEQIDTFVEFQSIKIVSILLLHNQIRVKLQLASKIFQIQFKQQSLNRKQQENRNADSSLMTLIKQQIFAIFISKIKNIQMTNKLVILYLFNNENNKLYFDQQIMKSITMEKQLNLVQKIVLIYECYNIFQVTLNFDRLGLKLKQTIFSKGKEKTYVKNIIYVVSYAMTNRQQLTQSGIGKLFFGIIKEQKEKEIIKQFQIAYKIIKEKIGLQKNSPLA